MRDKFVAATRKTGEGIETTARDLSNRARGIATSIQSKFTSDETDDAVLIDRVHSKLGRIVSHPGAIEVAAKNGNVTLTGSILEGEVDSLLTRVKRIQGVNEVVGGSKVRVNKNLVLGFAVQAPVTNCRDFSPQLVFEPDIELRRMR